MVVTWGSPQAIPTGLNVAYVSPTGFPFHLTPKWWKEFPNHKLLAGWGSFWAHVPGVCWKILFEYPGVIGTWDMLTPSLPETNIFAPENCMAGIWLAHLKGSSFSKVSCEEDPEARQKVAFLSEKNAFLRHRHARIFIWAMKNNPYFPLNPGSLYRDPYHGLWKNPHITG